MPSKGFKPNRRGLNQMQRDLQKEFDKRPVHVPVVGDMSTALPTSSVTNNYHGPVVTNTGDGAQLAVNSEHVTQVIEQAAPGYERLAEVILEILNRLPDVAELTTDERADCADAAHEIVEEAQQPEPDPKKIRRAVAAVKGYLGQILGAAGARMGTQLGDEGVHWAGQALERLHDAIPS